MTPSELIAAIRAGAEVTEETWDYVRLPWQIQPNDYLQFAQADISNTGRRGTINALSNAKRALECQLDSLALAVGLTVGEKRLRNVPTKLEALQELGVITPRVLSKLNKHRNELEHDYACPDHETVEDFVDVVALFIEATKRYIDDRVCEWIVELGSHKYIRVRRCNGGLAIAPANPPHAKPYVEVEHGTKEYLDLLQALLRGFPK